MANTEVRVLTVLNRIAAQVSADEDYAEMYAEMLDSLLGEAHGNDAFGTEGQSDPRGDFRNGEWSMNRVEGVDA
jgi:hypothetical protein